MCLCLTCTTFAQRVVKPSDGLVITGRIKKELSFALNDLRSIPTQVIPDIQLTGHTGEPKGTVKALKGFPLKVLLHKLEWANEKPKELNTYYFTLVATDSYKVVFSWNELFNTEVGNKLFVVTEKEGKKLMEMEERILVVLMADVQIGRWYIKGLTEIQVHQAF